MPHGSRARGIRMEQCPWSKKIDNPQTEIELIMDFIWDDLCKALWFKRNQIKHNEANNHCRYDEINWLTDKLKWYHRHHNEVLDCRHWILVNYDPTTLHQWHSQRMIDQFDLLETAHNYQDNAISQIDDNQTTLISWIKSPPTLHEGAVYIECTGTLYQWGQPQSIYTDSNINTLSQEQEFNLEPKSNTPRIHETQHTNVHKQTNPIRLVPLTSNRCKYRCKISV